MGYPPNQSFIVEHPTDTKVVNYSYGSCADGVTITKKTIEKDVYEEEESYVVNVKELYELLDKLKIVKKTGHYIDEKTKSVEKFK